MADSKITDLSDGGAIQSGDEFVVARSGANNKIAGSQLLAVLFDSTLGSDAANIDTGASGIASGYSSLMICARLRTADSAVNGDVAVTFNNDSSGNHYGVSYIGSASGTGPSHDTATAQNSINFLTMCGNTAASNAFGVLVGHVVGYTYTSALKVFDFTSQMPGSLTASIYCKNGLGFWNSTAAISRMAVAPVNAVNLKAGSRLTIYGIP